MSNAKEQRSNVIRINELEDQTLKLANAVQSLQNSQQVLQMFAKQSMTNLLKLSEEVKELNKALTDAQYFIHVLKNFANISEDTLNDEAAKLQVIDFEKAIEAQDAEQALLPTDLVEEDSVVVVTSTTPDVTPDKGFLRSRLEVEMVSIPEFRTNILGKHAGDTFSCDINGVKHDVTLLSVKKKPYVEPTTTEA